MLRGRIIAITSQGGTILADGSQLRFRAAEWRGAGRPGRGVQVEFSMLGAEAVNVCPLGTAQPMQNQDWAGAPGGGFGLGGIFGNTFGGPLGFNQTPSQHFSGRQSFWRFYFSPNGRVSRRQYWLNYLLPCFMLGVLALGLLVALVVAFFHHGMQVPVFLTLITLLLVKVTVLAWVSFVMHVKRYHDLNMSWQAGYIIGELMPLGRDWMLFRLMGEQGTPGPNAYGEDPRMMR